PVRDPAQSKTLSMRGNSSHGNREIPSAPAEDGAAGRSGKAPSRTPGTHAGGKSDGCIVPRKPPNKGRRPAEAVEGRQPTKGNTPQTTGPQTQSWSSALTGLERVRNVARQDKRARFTALLHHVTTDMLERGFWALKPEAAPGVDGLTWQQYEADLEARLRDL